jgi:hypothetical protein
MPNCISIRIAASLDPFIIHITSLHIMAHKNPGPVI